MEQNLDRITDNSTFTIPYIVFENSKVRAEKREKRNFFTVLVLIFLLVITNVYWMVYVSRFEKVAEVTTTTYVTQNADGDTSSIAGDGNNG